MPRPALRAATVAAALLAAACAHAQRMAPGLWEQSFTMQGAPGGQMDQAMAQMQKEMAAMTPEQRKMMEQMMAGRGMAMPGGAKPSTLRYCVTPEQAARDDIPQQDARCRQQSVQRSGNVVRFKFACDGDPPARGEGEVTFSSDKAHAGRVSVETVAGGKPEKIQIQQSGRWIGADCGSVKPRS